MANLKNITELPVAESADGLNLIVNDNGFAKQIAASAVGAQADWTETDETSASFIKNKPSIPTKLSDLEEEWDLDLTCDITWNTETSAVNDPVFTAAEGYSYNAFIAKIESGDIPKVKFRMNLATAPDKTTTIMDRHCNIMILPDGMYSIFISIGTETVFVDLNPNGTFTMGG